MGIGAFLPFRDLIRRDREMVKEKPGLKDANRRV
jgi:hypothetical protein